jgi:hypothetical protein
MSVYFKGAGKIPRLCYLSRSKKNHSYGFYGHGAGEKLAKICTAAWKAVIMHSFETNPGIMPPLQRVHVSLGSFCEFREESMVRDLAGMLALQGIFQILKNITFSSCDSYIRKHRLFLPQKS